MYLNKIRKINRFILTTTSIIAMFVGAIYQDSKLFIIAGFFLFFRIVILPLLEK